MPGHRFDTVGVAPLIKGIRFDAMLADKAFDSNWIIAEMNERGAVVIPPFLAGCIRRIHAAIFSFCAGVMPPMPMFGRSLL